MKKKKNKEMKKIKFFGIIKNHTDKEDRNDKIKVESFVDKYLALLDSDGLKDIKNNGFSLLNKALFCPSLKDIDFSKKIRLLGCYLDDNYLGNNSAIHFEKIYKLLDKKGKQYFVNKLLFLSEKLVHNAFHYEVLDFFIKNKVRESSKIQQRINQLKEL